MPPPEGAGGVQPRRWFLGLSVGGFQPNPPFLAGVALALPAALGAFGGVCGILSPSPSATGWQWGEGSILPAAGVGMLRLLM